MLITDVQVQGIQKTDAPAALEASPFAQLCFVMAGEGVFAWDGGRLPAGDGACLSLPAGTGGAAQGKMTLVRIEFVVRSRELARHLGDGPQILPVPAGFARTAILSILWESRQQPAFWEDAANLGLIRLLLAALAAREGRTFAGLPFGEAETALPLGPLTGYIDQHLAEEDVLEQLCQVAGRSLTQLNYLFKKHCDATALQWLNGRRLQKAKELLCFSPYTVTEIAEMTGFKSIHYFSRYFKMKVQVSPQKFQETILPAEKLKIG